MGRWAGLTAAILFAIVPCAHASHGPADTLLVLNSLSLPAIALDPVTGDRHFAYLSDGVLQHRWASGAAWQSEAIVDSASLTTYTGFHLRIAPDGHAVAAYVRKGTLVCAVRGAGGWEHDTLDVLPGPFNYPIALDLDPANGEPAVAWARKSPSTATPSQVFYARRTGGVWTTQQVDTTSSAWLNVALGIDGAGRPHIAWTRPGGAGQPRTVLMAGSGAGPDGPFSAAPVDSEMYSFLTMAMDRSNDEPRLLYVANAPNTFLPKVRYAYRTSEGSWQWTHVAEGDQTGNPPAPALALDPGGNPFVCVTNQNPIEPGFSGPGEPSEVAACGGAYSEDVVVHSRAGGAGAGPFSIKYVSPYARSGLASIASGAVGRAEVVWRTRIGCPPWGLTSTWVTSPVSVGLGGEPPAGLTWATPSPVRSGDALRLSLTLDRDRDVALVIHDVSGRRVASRAGSWAAGLQHLTWSVPELGPGLYWLTVRLDDAPIGSRALVILK